MVPLFLLCAALVTGCASTPKASPEVPGPPRLVRELIVPDDAMWWSEFGDEDLHTVITEALSGNVGLFAARDRLAQADAILRREGAAQRPDLNATVGAESSRRETDNGRRTGETYSLGLAASYELDLWGRLGAATDAARFEREASREALEAAGMTLAAETARTWITLAWRREQRVLLHEQIEVNRAARDWLRMRFEQGQSRAADVMQQEQSLENLLASLAENQGEAEVLVARLNVLRGKPSAEPATSELRMPGVPPLPMLGIDVERLLQRPDLRERFFRVQAADRDLADALAARRPRITLGARLGTEATSPTRLFEEWIGAVLADLVLPLVDGGSRRAEADRTRALFAQRLNEYGQAVLEAIAEWESALARERSVQAVLEHRIEQARLAESALESIRDLYVNGAADFQRWNTARLSLQNAQQLVLSTRLQQLSTRIDLHRATGGALGLSSSLEYHHE